MHDLQKMDEAARLVYKTKAKKNNPGSEKTLCSDGTVLQNYEKTRQEKQEMDIKLAQKLTNIIQNTPLDGKSMDPKRL